MIHLLTGDCRLLMAEMEPDTFDSIVCDPPYGLEFMGKAWDYSVPGAPFWTEAMRVLKPGGYLLAFGGTRTFHRLTCAIEDAGFEIRDVLSWLYGSGFPKSRNIGGGWGTALKPAWEPIILARKLLSEGTVAANVLKHGTGAINVDRCRIDSAVLPSERRTSDSGATVFFGLGSDGGERHNAAARWPANLVLDEEAAALLDEQSGERPSTGRYRIPENGLNMPSKLPTSYSMPPKVYDNRFANETGGASRFFYTAKASRSERNERVRQVGGTNSHPTVKPVDLMRWLCRLVTRPGGHILDPFVGSGSTLVAALMEGFDATGIDLNPEYITIAQQRIDGIQMGGLVA